MSGLNYIDQYLVKIQATNPVIFAVLIVVLLVWLLAWKGVALWKAARLHQKKWFIALLVLNTLGLLEIIYIFAIARKKEKQEMGGGSDDSTPEEKIPEIEDIKNDAGNEEVGDENMLNMETCSGDCGSCSIEH